MNRQELVNVEVCTKICKCALKLFEFYLMCSRITGRVYFRELHQNDVTRYQMSRL